MSIFGVKPRATRQTDPARSVKDGPTPSGQRRDAYATPPPQRATQGAAFSERSRPFALSTSDKMRARRRSSTASQRTRRRCSSSSSCTRSTSRRPRPALFPARVARRAMRPWPSVIRERWTAASSACWPSRHRPASTRHRSVVSNEMTWWKSWVLAIRQLYDVLDKSLAQAREFKRNPPKPPARHEASRTYEPRPLGIGGDPIPAPLE